MYGLEKRKKGKFDFDLEIEIKKNRKKKDEIINRAKKEIKEIEKKIKSTDKEKEIERLGIFLDGYHALKKVVSKI